MARNTGCLGLLIQLVLGYIVYKCFRDSFREVKNNKIEAKPKQPKHRSKQLPGVDLYLCSNCNHNLVIEKNGNCVDCKE